MRNTGATFIFSVMSLHVYCSYVLYPTQDIAAVSLIYTGWLALHITGTILIIYCSNSLANEVNVHNLTQYASISHNKIFDLRIFLLSNCRENEHSE